MTENRRSAHLFGAGLLVCVLSITALAQNSTWTDPSTGLMWTRQDNGTYVDWNQANNYCSNLRLAGYSNWRLATIDELQGIYDPTRTSGGYYIKGGIKLSNPWMWSSSKREASAQPLHFGFIHWKHPDFQLGYGDGKRALCVRR